MYVEKYLVVSGSEMAFLLPCHLSMMVWFHWEKEDLETAAYMARFSIAVCEFLLCSLPLA